MSNFVLALQVCPTDTHKPSRRASEPVTIAIGAGRTPLIEGELVSMTPTGCRVRIRREALAFDPQQIRIQSAWAEIVGRVVWTETTEEYVEMGVSIPER